MTASPSPSVGTTWVCIPTFNERENVRSLVQAVRDSLDAAGIDGHVLVIDDASPDGTGAIVDEMVVADSRVHVLHRAGKGGHRTRVHRRIPALPGPGGRASG